MICIYTQLHVTIHGNNSGIFIFIRRVKSLIVILPLQTTGKNCNASVHVDVVSYSPVLLLQSSIFQNSLLHLSVED